MARLARVVIAGHPHYVTQRGNGGAGTFFSDSDHALYRDLLGEHCRAAEVAAGAWRLTPNRVHLVLVPSDDDALRRARSPPCTGATPASSTRAAAPPAISGRGGSVRWSSMIRR